MYSLLEPDVCSRLDRLTCRKVERIRPEDLWDFDISDVHEGVAEFLGRGNLLAEALKKGEKHCGG